MSERDPFEHLRDLIDEPVAPRAEFASDLRSRLMREMSASDYSREEQQLPMDATYAPRPPLTFPIETPRRIRPMVLLEVAAAAIIILGLAAALSRGWFQNDPDPATAVPAAALQDDGTATPQTEPEPTSTPLPTVVPERTTEQATTTDSNGMEPTVVPPGDIPDTVWAIPGTAGENLDLGGMLIDDDTVYRLMATPDFVGVQAIDAENGAVMWQQAHRWAGDLFVIEDDVLYFNGGGNTLTAVDAETGAELWRASVTGEPIAMTEEDGRVFVLLSNDMVAALDAKTGDELWTAQGTVPQEITGGSASVPAHLRIAVEGNTVAAIASYGVLSGFDVATGEERWSHDGYEAATTSIFTEDDRFIVADAAGIWVDGEEVGLSGALSGSPEAGVQIGTASVGTVTDCAGVFAASGGSAAVQTGDTPDAAGTVVADVFRMQALDPATGEILWERESAPGVVSAWSPQLAQAPVSAVCAVEVASGEVIAIAGESDADDDALEIGVISGGSFVAGEFEGDAQAVTVAIGNVPQTEANAVIFAVGDDDFAILQLADGTLVKVAAGQMDDSDDHHDSDDDNDDGSPESESDDD